MSYKFTPDIPESVWKAYLNVQRSGVTNMWDTTAVEKFSKRECSSDQALYIIKHYEELADWFGYTAWN